MVDGALSSVGPQLPTEKVNDPSLFLGEIQCCNTELTECTGTTDGGATARIQVTNATYTADRTCSPCATNFWAAVGDNADCLANTLCGSQMNGITGDRLVGDSRTTAGTCAACNNGTFASDGASNCTANTVCGMQVGGTVGDRLIGASRTVAGTCAKFSRLHLLV